MIRILLIEEDLEISSRSINFLETAGFTVIHANSVQKGSELLQKFSIDLVLTEIDFEAGDSLALVREISMSRQKPSTPVIFTAMRCDLQTKLRAFESGAADFLSKPFDTPELLARIKVRLQDRGQRAHRSQLQRGDLSLDAETQRAWVEDRGRQCSLALTTSEFKLLWQLARAEESSISRRLLLELVWGKDIHVSNQTVYTHLSMLRKKLKPYGISIVFCANAGYQLLIESGVSAPIFS